MDNQPTGGAATIGRRNSIQTARLKPLRSHGRVALEAAATCTAGWPDATSWEAQAITEGRWIAGDPMTRRQDAEQDLEELQHQNERAAAIEREAWLELDTSKRLRRSMRMREEADAYLAEINGEEGRADARMDARGDRVAPVAIRASAVLQALARINERLPGMTGPMRVLALQARETALRALQSAGIDPTTSWAEAI